MASEAAEGFEIVTVSAVALARIREARFGTWDKHDPKDAQLILFMPPGTVSLPSGLAAHPARCTKARCGKHSTSTRGSPDKPRPARNGKWGLTTGERLTGCTRERVGTNGALGG